MTVEVAELRQAGRYIVLEPLDGSFGSATVTLCDVSERGLQIEHAQPLRIATSGRLWFKRGDVSVSTQATVVWSRLSQTPNLAGKLMYRSGVTVEVTTDFSVALQALADRGVIRRDLQSLERKRSLLQQREQAKHGRPVMKLLRTDNDVSPDQTLLIQHARERLRANPDEAQK